MKTAVAGIGVIGRVHVEVLRELGYAPAAVCDVIPERREGVAGAKGYGDFSEMLEKERPDVVHICTPAYAARRYDRRGAGQGYKRAV